MPLLEVTDTELQMLRECVEEHIALRQQLVNTMTPDAATMFANSVWDSEKARYDAQQDADIEGGLVL